MKIKLQLINRNAPEEVYEMSGENGQIPGMIILDSDGVWFDGKDTEGLYSVLELKNIVKAMEELERK